MKLFLIVCLGVILSGPVDGHSGCEDWQPFKEEKCFRIIDKLANYTTAVAQCEALNGQLLTIASFAEKYFLYRYLFISEKVVDNVWLGGRTRGGQMTWQDGSNLTYTDLTYKLWLKDNRSRNRTDACVQMNSEEGLKGNWAEVSCSKKNLIVCQKAQKLTLEGLREMVVELRKELEKMANKLADMEEDEGKSRIVEKNKDLQNRQNLGVIIVLLTVILIVLAVLKKFDNPVQ